MLNRPQTRRAFIQQQQHHHYQQHLQQQQLKEEEQHHQRKEQSDQLPTVTPQQQQPQQQQQQRYRHKTSNYYYYFHYHRHNHRHLYERQLLQQQQQQQVYLQSQQVLQSHQDQQQYQQMHMYLQQPQVQPSQEQQLQVHDRVGEQKQEFVQQSTQQLQSQLLEQEQHDQQQLQQQEEVREQEQDQGWPQGQPHVIEQKSSKDKADHDRDSDYGYKGDITTERKVKNKEEAEQKNYKRVVGEHDKWDQEHEGIVRGMTKDDHQQDPWRLQQLTQPELELQQTPQSKSLPHQDHDDHQPPTVQPSVLSSPKSLETLQHVELSTLTREDMTRILERSAKMCLSCLLLYTRYCKCRRCHFCCRCE